MCRATAFIFFGALSSVRNIKFASSLAHGASTCVFDLLTGLFIRAIHRMALIPAPLESAIFFTCSHILPDIMTAKDEMGPCPQFAISNALRFSRKALQLAHLICSLASRFAPFTGRCSSRAPADIVSSGKSLAHHDGLRP